MANSYNHPGNHHPAQEYSQYQDLNFPFCGTNEFVHTFQASTPRPQPNFVGLQNPGAQLPAAPSNHAAQPAAEDNAAKKRERWNYNDEHVLLQLWADNIEKIESKDSRVAWEDITRSLNEKQGTKKTVDQCQRKVKHLKTQYKGKKDWNRRQSGGNIQKSPHYDLIDSVLGCRDIITCTNVEQAGTPRHKSGASSEGSTASPTPSSSSSTAETPDTAVKSVDKRRERKKSNKRPARVDSDSDDETATIGQAIKKLSSEGDQVTRVMERLQESQAQQMQLMARLLGTFDRYMESKMPKKD